MAGTSGRGKGKSPPQKRKVAERRLEALRLHKAGKSYREIAERLGVSSTQVGRDIAAVMRELNVGSTPPPTPSPAENDALAERRIEAYELHKKGMSYREIGRVLKISHTQAGKDIQQVAQEIRLNSLSEAADRRQLMVDRIAAARLAIVTQVYRGDLSAVKVWVMLNEQEIKLFGLNEPQRFEFGFDPELMMAMDRLGVSPSEAFEQFRQIIMSKAAQHER